MTTKKYCVHLQKCFCHLFLWLEVYHLKIARDIIENRCKVSYTYIRLLIITSIIYKPFQTTTWIRSHSKLAGFISSNALIVQLQNKWISVNACIIFNFTYRFASLYGESFASYSNMNKLLANCWINTLIIRIAWIKKYKYLLFDDDDINIICCCFFLSHSFHKCKSAINFKYAEKELWESKLNLKKCAPNRLLSSVF